MVGRTIAEKAPLPAPQPPHALRRVIRTHSPAFDAEPTQRARPEFLTTRLRRHQSGSGSLLLVGDCFRDGIPVGPEQLHRAIAEDGLDAVSRHRGSFSIELHDRSLRTVTLIQSEFGHRHMYYRADREGLTWGLDLRAMGSLLDERRMSQVAMREALSSRWCMGESSFIEGIHQMQPATALTFDSEGGVAEHRLPYFRFSPGEDEPWDYWVDALMERLSEEVESVLAWAENPVVLLSGGVDSPLLAGVADQIRPGILCVTPTWASHDDPELPRARRVAEHLGLNHHVLPLTDDQFANAAKGFVSKYGFIPRDYWAVVLRATFEHFDVASDAVIHGQGADSIFGGSWRIRRRKNRQRTHLLRRLLPGPMRRSIASLLPLDTSHLGDLRVLLTDDPEMSVFRRGIVELDRGVRERHLGFFGEGYIADAIIERFWSEGETPLESQKLLGMCTVHRCNLMELTSIADEHRTQMLYPFFGERIMDLAFRLPDHRATTPEHGKKPIVKKAYARLFPAEWADEPKLGFTTPHRELLSGVLKEWLFERLGPGSLAALGLGDGVDDLRLDRDYQLMWTLASLEDFLRTHEVEAPHLA